MEMNSLSPRQRRIRDMGGSGFPWSRDFELPNLPCKRIDCVCNNGSGKCTVPSLISIGSNGRCEGYRSKKEGK